MAKQKFTHFIPRPKPRKRPGRHTKILVNEKQIQLLQNQIDELKAKSDNPLAG